MKQTEETSAPSALSSSWESCASIRWNTELPGPVSVSDPEQMDEEAGDTIQHFGSDITPSSDHNLKIPQIKLGKYVQFPKPVGSNSNPR